MSYNVFGVTLNLAQLVHTAVHFLRHHPVLSKCTRKMLNLSHIIQPATHCGNEVNEFIRLLY